MAPTRPSSLISASLQSITPQIQILTFLDHRVASLSCSSHHFDIIREAVSSLATDAFPCSVRRGALTTAVELVEQGRAVFWTQLARFSTSLDELSVSGDMGTALAEEFKRLNFCLRSVFDKSTEDRSPQIRQLTMQWDDVITLIRMLPEFSRFLLPSLSSDLQKAAEDGPVIIVNANRYICDALIIHSAENPVHVSLGITQAEVSEFSFEFRSLAEQFEPYEKKRDNLSDIDIFSYTPTLATLVRVRQQVSRDASSQHFVAIGQGNPVKGRELKCVAFELAAVAQHVAPIVSFTSLEDAQQSMWLHLVCRAMPNRTQLFKSSFAMRDHPLMIRDIIRSNWQSPQFIFLSACHTTMGDKKSPDEIHLATAMQFCGFRSVVGSMWSVDDEVARQIELHTRCGSTAQVREIVA
ncbi:hypothetical protein EV424DRAFT_1344956 [Suillus variegatus]|nr:hypothetical protein EV424DRAFT_1344956 [Suillus variegatus]